MFNIVQRVVNEETQLRDDTQLVANPRAQLIAYLFLVLVDILHNLLAPFAGEDAQVCRADAQVRTHPHPCHTHHHPMHATGLLLENHTQLLLQ